MLYIADRPIGAGAPCFVVAELSCNHLGRKAVAIELIRHAHDAGADAVKLQLFTPADMVPPEAKHRPEYQLTEGPWAGRSLWDLYTEAMTPREWFPDLFAYARGLGLVPFASVFSREGIAYLEGLGCPAYKIASPENVDRDLIEAAKATGRPVIVSEGMGGRAPAGTIPLLCVSGYPAPLEAMALGRLAKRWPIGLSDHTGGRWPELYPAAVALGASVIEIHLRLPISEPHADEPLDGPFSVEPDRLAAIVQAIRTTETLLRADPDATAAAEAPTQQARRRLVTTRPVAAGEALTLDMLRTARAKTGPLADRLPDYLGATVTRDYASGEPL